MKINKGKLSKAAYKKYQKSFKNLIGIDAGEIQPGETPGEAVRREITWLREWAEECAQSLERDFCNHYYDEDVK